MNWHENAGLGLSATRPIAAGVDGAAAVHAADLDGDGDADVLYAAYLDDALYWHENLGGGGVRRPASRDGGRGRSVGTYMPPTWMETATRTCCSASLLDDTVGWFENLGGGTFAGRRAISMETLGAVSVHAADLDGDGDADVLSASLFDDGVGWHENLGGGAFAERRAISTQTLGAVSVHAADLDGDGDARRAVGIAVGRQRLDGTRTWAAGRSPGAVRSRRGCWGAVSVHVADLDGDGDMDVLAAASLDGAMYWHENLGGGEFTVPRVLWAGPLGAASMHRHGPEWRRHRRCVAGRSAEWTDCKA